MTQSRAVTGPASTGPDPGPALDAHVHVWDLAVRPQLAETGSLGARRHHVRRLALPRRETEVTVGGHRIRVKIGPHRAKPEHDDVAAAAAATGLPARVVAEQALRQLGPGPG